MNILEGYEKGFLEGFLDADGSISLSHRNDSSRLAPIIKVIFSNNSQEILSKIQKILGTNMKHVLKKGSKNYQFQLTGSKAVKLLKQLNLIVKEHRRVKAIELWEYVQMNGRGKNQHTRPSDYKEKLVELIGLFYH